MKKNNTLKKIDKLLVLFLIILSASGCTVSSNKNVKTLTVLAESSFEQQIEKAATNMELLNEEIEVKIQYLSRNEEQREIEIQKIRTQIMAGKGPDVYIMDGLCEWTTEVKNTLFENPYQVMQSGALAPLDDFMGKDSYWKNSTYKEEVLEAGKSDGRQYIIPFSCQYFVYAKTPDIETMQGATVKEWLKQVENSSDYRVKEAFRSGFFNLSSRWFQPAINYEKKEVRFDQNQWCEFASDFLAFQEKTSSEVEDQKQSCAIREVVKENLESGMELQVIPDLEGRKAAAITSYGAVGMSSEMKQEAYDFLMLFLNDRIEKLKAENPDVLRPSIEGYLDKQFIPVQESSIEAWLGTDDEQVIRELKESLEEIDYAFFLTPAERELSQEFDQLFFEIEDLSLNQDMKLQVISKNAWETYKMMLEE